jgi:hypothetical protein
MEVENNDQITLHVDPGIDDDLNEAQQRLLNDFK